MFENFCATKTFTQTTKFVSEILLKKWGSITRSRLHRAQTDESKTLKLTISTLRIFS